MTFRYAGEKDAGLVLEFLKRLSEYEKAEEHLVSTASMLAEELGRENGARALFVLAEGREVGCALFFRNFSGYLGRSGIFIDALIVLEEYRGKGYGKALFEELKKETKRMGGGRMEWLCLDWNTPSMKFYQNNGCLLYTSEVFFLEADADTTVTEPGSSRAAMTVAYYNGRDNGVDIHSGRGYTRNEIIKPDYAAPGTEVTGAGIGGEFVSRTSSSAAAGIAAGASALLMEWLKEQPGVGGVNSIQIRNTIILGAGKRDFMEYPNREWGYGTLNVYQSLDRLRQL